MKSRVFALALASLTAGAFAQSAPAPVAATASDLAVRGGISWSGKNVFRGKARSSTDGLIQSDITAEYNIPGFSGVSAYLSFFSADSFERVYVLGARTDDALGRLDVGIQRSAAVFLARDRGRRARRRGRRRGGGRPRRCRRPGRPSRRDR